MTKQVFYCLCGQEWWVETDWVTRCPSRYERTFYELVRDRKRASGGRRITSCPGCWRELNDQTAMLKAPPGKKVESG